MPSAHVEEFVTVEMLFQVAQRQDLQCMRQHQSSDAEKDDSENGFDVDQMNSSESTCHHPSHEAVKNVANFKILKKILTICKFFTVSKGRTQPALSTRQSKIRKSTQW